MYEYRAKVIRVIDGDTVELEVDLGFHTKCVHHFRLLDVDAPEVRTRDTVEKLKGTIVKDRLSNLLLPNLPVTIQSENTGKFGRWLAHIKYKDININNLVEEWTDEVNSNIDSGNVR